MKFENQYLTYEEYKQLKGNLSKMPFNSFEYQAEKEVDKLTSSRFKKIKEYPFELKMCIFVLISELKKYDKTGNKVSQTVGNFSVTYDNPIATEKSKNLKEIIKTYLSDIKVDGINVLYCGVDE